MSAVVSTRTNFGYPVLYRSWPFHFMFALASLALGISGYLAWVGLTGNSVAGCDGSLMDCSHVLTSRWSKFAGLPVAVPATLLYAILIPTLIVIVRSPSKQTLGRFSVVALTLTTSAALAGIWFIGLQATAVGHWCPYCIVAHACGLMLAVMSWRRLKVPVQGKMLAVGVSFVGLTGLIAAQLVAEPPPTFRIEYHDPVIQEAVLESPESSDVFDSPLTAPETDAAPDASDVIFESPLAAKSRSAADHLAWLGFGSWGFAALVAEPDAAGSGDKERLVPVANGQTKLKMSDWPLYGKVTQKYVIAEMFDYNCDHCRTTHRAIVAAKELLGGELAVLALPTPLHQSCNPQAKNNSPGGEVACELAKLAIAVWLVDRDRFPAMHDWLLLQERDAKSAKDFAATLVDAEKLNQMLAGGMPGKFVAANVKLYAQAGSGTLPKLMTQRSTLVGEIGSGKTIADLVR